VSEIDEPIDEAKEQAETPAVSSEPPRVVVMPSDDERLALERRNDDEVRRTLSRQTRRSFLFGAAATIAGAATWKWLDTRPREAGAPWPYRRSLEWNDRLAERYFKRDRLSPVFRPDQITRNRVNGHIGLDQRYDVSTWNLTIVGAAGAAAPIVLTMDDILSLPKHEVITELRCIEGWSIIVKWTGARLADLMQKFPPPTRDGSKPDVYGSPQKLTRFVAMETPSRGYYVGLDMNSAAHPQTLLAYAMNDQALDWHHGSPLRLAIPVKYGIKNIKRPSLIRYTDVRPADFWAEQGYDYYAGH
jgi:DMSO/TMAO reductase YedYZ molybdopterin-dependent catalytic subunit